MAVGFKLVHGFFSLVLLLLLLLLFLLHLFDPTSSTSSPLQQKIVVNVSMADEKMRTQAIQIAAGMGGTIKSVAIDGENRDQLVVVGVGVDPVRLTRQLRKRMAFGFSLTMKGLFRRRPGFAQLISVAPVEEKEEEKEDKAPPPPFYFSAVPGYQLYEMSQPSYNMCHIL